METNKKLLFENEARQRILVGVEKLATAVRVTLGPRGRNVVIERIGQAPHITKDGVTVARSINLKDQFANIGAQMLKEVASQTVDVAGDGTTTATILAHAIYKEGLKLIAGGHNPTDLKKGIDMAVELVTEELVKNSVKVGSNQDILHIGTVSANGDESVGKMLAEAMEKVGNDGVITVEEAKGYNTTLEVVEGMQFNRGYTSPFFVTNNEKLTAELENPYILITNKKYDSMKALLPVLEPVAKSKRPILVIVDDIEGEALNSLTVNKMKGVLNVCAIRGPEFGSARHSMLEDIAILTGGQIVSDASGIKEGDININDPEQAILGTASKVIVGKGTTTIVSKKDRKEEVEKRVEEIKKHLEEPNSEEEDKLLRRRLSRLAGGVAILRVGGATEVEMRERKDRVDDALCATQAAVEAGIVPGGGTALVHASKVLDAEIEEKEKDFNVQYGMKIIKEACKAPLMQIVENAGSSPDVILASVIKEENSNGWNAATEEFCNLIEDGIIDPVKVPKTALENAASVAGLMLTVEAAIAEDDPDTLRRLVEQMQ
jgi:chaperonin GroEL